MESQNIEFRACMVIVAQSIPQWQSGQQNLNMGETP